MGPLIFFVDTKLRRELERLFVVLASCAMVESIVCRPNARAFGDGLAKQKMAQTLPPSRCVLRVANVVGCYSEAEFPIALDMALRALRREIRSRRSFNNAN